MDDHGVIDAFVNDRAQRAFGETLHIEGDTVLLDGFWHILIRVGDNAFIVRAEEPPIDTKAFDQIADVLGARGLSHVATDLPGITVITMEKASLGFVSWDVWATDEAAGRTAVADAVTDETFLDPTALVDPNLDKDYSAELHGARRLAGLPTSLVLTVGIDDERLAHLGAALEDCHFISRELGAIDGDACCSLIPTLVLIDATEAQGREFVMQVRTASCGRVIPVVAVTPEADIPLGADAAVATASDPATWAEPIRNLLP